MKPCARPKVIVEPRTPAPGDDRYDVTCHVPGCDWTYPLDKEFMALKSDADWHATQHRREHRSLVPVTSIVRDPEYDVHCEPCGGHRRTFGTRREAQVWLDEHLAIEHGLVSCA